MAPRNRAKHKGRREGGTFTAIPHAVQDSANWKQCSGTGIKFVCDLGRMYNGGNNGDLCPALLKAKGWKAPDTRHWAMREASHYGLIVLTRQGGLNRASLYALSWHPIDECGGKLDCSATKVPPGTWREQRAPFKRPRKKQNASTESVQGPIRNPYQ